MHNHATQPEIWFRPSPRLPLKALLSLLEAQVITATPRLGVRDAKHPKGYAPGQTVLLRVLDEDGTECLTRPARIKQVRVGPINTLTSDDLRHIGPYSTWEEVHEDLAYFEMREIAPTEPATIVEFAI